MRGGPARSIIVKNSEAGQVPASIARNDDAAVRRAREEQGCLMLRSEPTTLLAYNSAEGRPSARAWRLPKGRRQVPRLVDDLGRSWMEFSNQPQARAVTVFSSFWRGTLLRVKGNIATELGERYYGLRPANFPLPCRILADLPAHGGKLGQSLAGLLARASALGMHSP